MFDQQYQTIRKSFASLRRDGVRHRDIADKLGISEGELIASHAGVAIDAGAIETRDSPLQAVRLRAEWPGIIGAIEPLGEVMALTRNAHCVHEKSGVYRGASHSERVGLVLGGAIDLRIFYRQWAHGFAVRETTDQGVQRSLQFFDAAGAAIHKIFLRPASEVHAYDALVDRFTAADQATGMMVVASAAPGTEKADADIDVAAFRDAWASLRDTHEFFGLLKRYSVSRTQGLRLADPEFARRVDAMSARKVLDTAADEGLPIMVFVGNPGMIQIHSGPVKNIAVMDPWINVLDDGFNLHLRGDRIASAWVVRKPTEDGIVTSLELFDAAGETIAMLFGERKPGKPELNAWRVMLERLTREPAPCAA